MHITPILVKQLQYKSMQTYKKTKSKNTHKHNIYVNVGEIYDRRGPYRLKSSDCFMKRRGPYRLKSSDCFMKVKTTDKRSEVGLSM